MKDKLSAAMTEFAAAVKQNSPGILTGVGIAGFISTTFLAVAVTPKALKKLSEARSKKGRELTKKEVVKETWKCYIPAVATGTLSTACLIGSHSIQQRRNAALSTALSLSESALKAYSEKVVETIGEKKERQIRDAVAKEEVTANPPSKNEIIFTGRGETLCYDTVSARYFKYDIEKLRKIENQLNKRLISEMYISLNELYYEIGLNPISVGEDLGWNVNDSLIEFDFSSQLTEDDTPCLVISYHVAPRYDFRSLH